MWQVTRRKALKTLGLIGSVIGVSSNVAAQRGDTTQVPTFKGDAARTGQTTTNLPVQQALSESWTHEIAGVNSIRAAWPIPVDDSVIIGVETFDNMASQVLSVNTGDGSVKWSHDTQAGVSAPHYDGETIYVGSETLRALDPKDGTLDWKFEPSGGLVAVPNSKDDVVYATDNDYLYGLTATNGDVSFESKIGERVCSAPAIRDESVYVASAGETSHTYAFDLEGNRRWKVELSQSVQKISAVSTDAVYVAGSGETVYKLSRETGDTEWSTDVGGKLSTPSLTPGHVIVTDEAGAVAVLNRQTGKPIPGLSTEIGSGNRPPLATVTNRAYVPGKGKVVSVDAQAKQTTQVVKQPQKEATYATAVTTDDALYTSYVLEGDAVLQKFIQGRDRGNR